MAMTVVDLWMDAGLRDEIATEFATLPRGVDVLS